MMRDRLDEDAQGPSGRGLYARAGGPSKRMLLADMRGTVI